MVIALIFGIIAVILAVGGSKWAVVPFVISSCFAGNPAVDVLMVTAVIVTVMEVER